MNIRNKIAHKLKVYRILHDTAGRQKRRQRLAKKEERRNRKINKRASHRDGSQVGILGVPRRDLFAIGILISGGFITFFNQTVLSPAIPSIMAEFAIDASAAQWLTTVFLLVNGVMVPVTAFLIDRFSTKTLFVVSMGLFFVGSVVIASSGSFLLIICGRVLQALGAGIQFPLGAVCMMRLFPKSKRGFAMGIVGVVVNFAPAIGPTISGLVIDLYGWQLIFWYIAAAALLDIVFALFFLRNIGEKRDVHLDFLSVVLSTVAFGGLLFGFSYAGSYGWGHASVIAPLTVGGIVLVFFIRRQLGKREPFLDLNLLKLDTFAVSVIIIMFVSASLMVGTVITPIFIQTVLGYSALYSGLALMPGAVLMCILSPITGNIFDKLGPRRIAIVGLVTLTVASVFMGVMPDDVPLILITVAYTVRAVGITFVNMPINTWGINALENEAIAHGNAISNTGRQMAGSLGTALLVTLMSMVAIMFADTGTVNATAVGINAAFMGSAVLSLVGLILTIVKVDRKTKK